MTLLRRRRQLVAALLVPAAIAVGITAANLSDEADGPGPSREPVLKVPSLAGGTTSATITTASPSPPTSPEASGTITPGTGYLTIGTNDRRQFSDDEYRAIAADYETVVLTKFHGGWEVSLHHEAARRLKELNPELRVFAYMSTKYWFDAFRWGEEQIDPDWFLRDDDGEPVPVTKESYDLESKELGHYVDVSDPAYRDWIVEVARSWMAAAPYDGIRFDAASPIGDFGDRDVKKWNALLGSERIEAYNDGIETLFRAVGDAIAPRRVLFNGISPSPMRGPGRDLFMLDFTDGAMDENFCATGDGQLHDLVDDIAIMQRQPDKALHLRARYDARKLQGEADRRRIERACSGAFFMGWQPGFSFLNVGTNYSVAQLAERPPELDLDLGPPTGPHRREGDVLWRQFGTGIVYVNLGSSAVTLEVPSGLVLADGTERVPLDNGRVSLAPQDAAFLVSVG